MRSGEEQIKTCKFIIGVVEVYILRGFIKQRIRASLLGFK